MVRCRAGYGTGHPHTEARQSPPRSHFCPPASAEELGFVDCSIAVLVSQCRRRDGLRPLSQHQEETEPFHPTRTAVNTIPL